MQLILKQYVLLALPLTLLQLCGSSSSSEAASRPASSGLKPIPARCTVSSPLASLLDNTNYAPAPPAMPALMDSYVLQREDLASSYEKLWTECLQSCYASAHGEKACRSAFMAREAPAVGQGTCMLFSRALDKPGDFVQVVSGRYEQPLAGDIACPAAGQ